MSVYNFCAGPAMLPASVLAKAQAELVNWQQSGCSVMEVSHRSKPYLAVAEKAEQDLRDLMAIPDNYSVLFLQGGGRGQFAAVPLNLHVEGQQAVYCTTGHWSNDAIAEAERYAPVVKLDCRQDVDGMFDVKPVNQWQLPANASFVHYCPNETINGIELFDVPASQAPLVADMSSNILSRPVNVTDYGVIYAGAQKNIGPSGLAVVIVRKDLLARTGLPKPGILDYALNDKHASMYNTPPTFAWYLAGLAFEWLKDMGGVSAIEQVNIEKAKCLYDFIDNSTFYSNNVAAAYRSRMNIPFWLKDSALETEFLAKAKSAGLVSLEGHRVVGGLRASIYNAMPLAGVQALVSFMKRFEMEHR